MPKPMRPLNRCRACGDTWHPRGQNVSDRCPTCGSAKVGLAAAAPTAPAPLAAPKVTESRYSGRVAGAVFLGLCAVGVGLVIVPVLGGR